jgi:hypothetical protein
MKRQFPSTSAAPKLLMKRIEVKKWTASYNGAQLSNGAFADGS